MTFVRGYGYGSVPALRAATWGESYEHLLKMLEEFKAGSEVASEDLLSLDSS